MPSNFYYQPTNQASAPAPQYQQWQAPQQQQWQAPAPQQQQWQAPAPAPQYQQWQAPAPQQQQWQAPAPAPQQQQWQAPASNNNQRDSQGRPIVSIYVHDQNQGQQQQQQYQPPAPQYQAPAPQYQAPAPQYQAPAPQYQAPAPQQRFSGFDSQSNQQQQQNARVIPQGAYYQAAGNDGAGTYERQYPAGIVYYSWRPHTTELTRDGNFLVASQK